MSELRADTITSLTTAAVNFPTGMFVTGNATVNGNAAVSGNVTASGDVTVTGGVTASTLQSSGTTSLTTANITNVNCTNLDVTNLTVGGTAFSSSGAYAFFSVDVASNDTLTFLARYNINSTPPSPVQQSSSIYRYTFLFETPRPAGDDNYLVFTSISGSGTSDYVLLVVKSNSGFTLEAKSLGSQDEFDCVVFEAS